MADTEVPTFPRSFIARLSPFKRTATSSSAFKPPENPPFDIPDSELRSAFMSAVTGNLNSNLKNNASLKAEDIVTLARKTYNIPRLLRSSFAAGPKYFTAEYRLATHNRPGADIIVSITNCENATEAQKMMVNHLRRFQAVISVVTSKPKHKFGQVALQADRHVFWVRDALWVKVSAEEQFNSVNDSSLQGLQGSSFGLFTRDTVTPLLLKFAEILDGYIMNHAVSPANQLRPSTDLENNNYVAVKGELVIVKLVDSTNIHEFSRVEVEKQSVVVQTENKDPSVRGVYTFWALSLGITKLKIMLARADNFAMGAAEITINVEKG